MCCSEENSISGRWRVALVMFCAERQNGGVADVQLVVPPCVVATTSASAIYDGIFNYELTKPMMLARELLLRTATFRAVDMSEFDGAMSNTKLEAGLVQLCNNKNDAAAIANPDAKVRLSEAKAWKRCGSGALEQSISGRFWRAQRLVVTSRS